MLLRLGVVALAASALLAAGCGGDGTGQEGASLSQGKELFVSGADGNQSCGSCHTLLDAGTAGTIGPNLDQAFGYSCAQGFEESTTYSTVLGQIDLAQGAMPADLVTGQDAVDVAAYVASVAGKDIPGCDPSGDQGDATTTEPASR
ncbi:MAG TPA: c-type cytochrome [Gaiellaceae bacterium]|nr:c-type cytochrome [Gaiellaceae bacterium]